MKEVLDRSVKVSSLLGFVTRPYAANVHKGNRFCFSGGIVVRGTRL
jgi:hypothetical protein